jgi:hypothetical protein
MSALTVTILICAASMPQQACQEDTAIAVLKPAASLYETRQSLPGCATFAQAYAASLHYLEPGPDGKPVAYVKSRCSLGERAG